ncbi:hypothetical protein DAPPUDRAFT_94585 [Daphnia pulex]|uniref:Chitin-binding type-2 domain-containing protein n=1 Tax=Daphnia pulex TaxID=6669 RepID=E9FSG5_DAPPU|nr:hypothetical protein DAPPUDRAFT_94585 [Daphnia pulex]|eukprot:EFX89836.1 hypothetical protein DAPPUDRAFT_94585 [Daphnia pulex]
MSLQFFFLFSIVVAFCCCDWPTLTNAEPYGFSAATKEIPVGRNGNFVSASSSSFDGTGSVSAAAAGVAASSSFAGLTQDQIDGQLAGLRTGEMISINNVRYMALRSEDDPAARRDTIILVQVAGQSDASLSSGDSYTAAISHLTGRVPDESTTGSRVGQSHYHHSAPSAINSANRRANIIGDGASVGSYSAPYSPAIIRQETNAVASASVNGGAGVNDPSSSSSLSSYSSPAEWMAGNVDRQSSTDAGRDHSSSSSYSYHPPSASSSAGRIRPNVSRVPFLNYDLYSVLMRHNSLSQNGHEEKWDYSKSIPGVAGRDYPILSAVVRPTSFSCNGRKDGGYYADVESSCQVYHVCALDKTFSFLCPNGTIFDQRVFVCRWWHNVDCASSANYYNLNDLIGISPATQQPATLKNPIHFPSAASYGPAAAAPTKLVVQQQQPIQSSTTGVSQKPLKQIYGPPPSSAVLQPVLIEEAIRPAACPATLASWKRFAHSHFYIAVIKTAAADLNEPVAMGFFFSSCWPIRRVKARVYTLDNYFASSSLTPFMTVSPVQGRPWPPPAGRTDGRTAGQNFLCRRFRLRRWKEKRRADGIPSVAADVIAEPLFGSYCFLVFDSLTFPFALVATRRRPSVGREKTKQSAIVQGLHRPLLVKASKDEGNADEE